MKKLFLILIINFIVIESSYACKYSGKMYECRLALNSFIGTEKNSMSLGTRIKSIEHFPCIQGSEEDRYYQIAMDENFNFVDEESYEYLKMLFENKNYYFGKDAVFNYFNAVDDINRKKEYFLYKYYDACETVYKDAKDCLLDPSLEEESPATSIFDLKDFLPGSQGDCYRLADLKSKIFLEVAENGLFLNEKQVSKDQKKDYKIKEQKGRNNVSRVMNINYSYIERLWKKWTSKTKHTLGPK